MPYLKKRASTKRRPRRRLSAIGAVLALAAFSAGPGLGSAAAEEAVEPSLGVTPFAEEGCVADEVCTYSEINFEGNRTTFGCHPADVENFVTAFSARNRCGSRVVYVHLSNNSLICMNPGGNRPNPGLITWIEIGTFENCPF